MFLCLSDCAFVCDNCKTKYVPQPKEILNKWFNKKTWWTILVCIIKLAGEGPKAVAVVVAGAVAVGLIGFGASMLLSAHREI